jgi:Skp family chaperone for outer membrane proteins
MSQSPVWGRVLVAGCIVCCLAFALNADGQAGKPQVFATVDVEKVNSEFIERKTEEANLRALDSRFRQRIQRRQAMPFLDEEEHKTIDSLEEKDNKTAEETKRLKDLTDKGNALNAQVTTLRTKEDSKLTPEEKEALRKFESDFQALQGRLQKLNEELNQQMQQRVDATGDRLMQKFKAAVQKVAEQKGITLVFNSQVVLYAGSDLTAAVLKELNGK